MTKLIWNCKRADELACRVLIRGFLLRKDSLFAKLIGFCLFPGPGLAVVLSLLLVSHLTPLLPRLLLAVVIRQALLGLVPAIGWLVLAMVVVLGLLVVALFLLVGVALLVACGLLIRLRAKAWLAVARRGLVCRRRGVRVRVEIVLLLLVVEEL